MAVGGSYGTTTGYGGVKYKTYKAPYVAPPPPNPAEMQGFYNPRFDVEEAEGKRGGEQERHRLERERGYSLTNYNNRLSQIAGTRDRSLKTLAESFARLKGRQTEGANTAGELYGGALIQAAAKRAHNEGLRSNEINRVAREGEEGAALDYKRAGEGFGEGLLNNETNEQGYLAGLGKLRENEATERGYRYHAPYPQSPVAAQIRPPARHVVGGEYKRASGHRTYRPRGYGTF